MSLARTPSGIRIGFITTTSMRITYADGFARAFQYVAPSVFGTISEKTSTEKVRIAEKPATQGLPNVRPATAPPRAAPMVFAIVFSVRIAAMGSSTFRWACSSQSPAHSPSFLRIAMWEWVTERKVASRIEHMNDVPSVAARIHNRVAIVAQRTAVRTWCATIPTRDASAHDARPSRAAPAASSREPSRSGDLPASGREDALRLLLG